MVKCSEVLQCSDGLSTKVSDIIRRLTDNMKLLLICILLLSHSFISFRFYFLSMYVWLYSCLIVCLCMATLTEVFPCFFFSCRANARIKPAKTGTARTLPNFCVFMCIVCFVSFCVFFVCICVLYYCHRMATQLQLTNIYHILSFKCRHSLSLKECVSLNMTTCFSNI